MRLAVTAAPSREDRRVYLIEGEMRIEVNQLPPAECSPNARIHWSERYQAAEIYQGAVFYECVDARNRLERLPWRPGFPSFQKPRVNLTFVFPNYRKRDEDNLRARFKPGLDAIVQARLVEDDSIDILDLGKITVEVDKERAPLTIIDIEEMKLKGESDGTGKSSENSKRD